VRAIAASSGAAKRLMERDTFKQGGRVTAIAREDAATLTRASRLLRRRQEPRRLPSPTGRGNGRTGDASRFFLFVSRGVMQSSASRRDYAFFSERCASLLATAASARLRSLWKSDRSLCGTGFSLS
jgi:hypothetical protein